MAKSIKPIRLTNLRNNRQEDAYIPKMKRSDKIEKEIKDLQGNVVFVGTEAQWRKWAQKHRTPFLTSKRRRRRR